jgi:hypothetical protein
LELLNLSIKLEVVFVAQQMYVVKVILDVLFCTKVNSIAEEFGDKGRGISP